ncbi:MAG: phage Gp37/Gp68 family protein [Dehalococcoidia bacterium]|jgi:protein gp37
MALSSSIEWTEATWNPVTGCTKISPGCKNCYAERMALRLQAMANPSYANGFTPTMHYNLLHLPLHWKRPQMIFVNSMSDLFHEAVSDDFIFNIFDTMNNARWHNFQILTKRTERLIELAPRLLWANNIWMGVTVELAGYEFRIDHLRQTGAQIKFVSFEPLLGPIRKINLEGVDWVIVGGESGPQSRPVNISWVTGIRDQCKSAEISFFFKQWGGVNKKRAGRELEGRTWDEMPLLCEPA